MPGISNALSAAMSGMGPAALANPWMAAMGPMMGMLGGIMGNSALSSGMSDIKGLTKYNPYNLSGDFGSVAFGKGAGGATLDPMQQMLRQMLGGSAASMFGGGQMFNQGDFQNALAGNNITGAMQNQNGLLSQMMGNSAFGGLGQIAGNAGGLNSMFSQMLAGGPQDMSGGAMGGLMGMGLQNLQNAGNLSGANGLIQQQLDAQRLLAQPYEDNLRNQFANQEFMKTRGATTGAFGRQSDLQDNLLRADAQRVLGAQGLGLQAQQQLGQLGGQQMGLGQGFLGQNLDFFNQLGNQAQGFGQLGMGAEGMGFGQMLQALQQNQSSGQQRLGNAMNLFGLGNSTFNQSFGQGLGAMGSINDQNSFLLQGLLGSMNAESNRIGSTGLHAQALGGLAQAQGGLLGGLMGGIGGLFN